MSVENCIVHLIGYPGTGKLTIAKEMQKKTGMRLMDNHAIANLLFIMMDKDGETKIPDHVWEAMSEIKQIVLDAMPRVAPKELSFIFTNCLYANCDIDERNYNMMVDAADKRGGQYIPVVLTCAFEENRKRVTGADRAERMKMTSEKGLESLRQREQLMVPNHPNVTTIDVTTLSAEDAATQIIAHVHKVARPAP